MQTLTRTPPEKGIKFFNGIEIESGDGYLIVNDYGQRWHRIWRKGIVVEIENEMGIGGGIHFGSGEVEEIGFEGTDCGYGIVCYCQNPILHESFR